jgi:hypothetical protein
VLVALSVRGYYQRSASCSTEGSQQTGSSGSSTVSISDGGPLRAGVVPALHAAPTVCIATQPGTACRTPESESRDHHTEANADAVSLPPGEANDSGNPLP